MKTTITHYTPFLPKILTGLLVIIFLTGCPPKPPPPTARDHYDQGMSAFNQGDYRYAANSFEKAVDMDRNFADAYFQLGRSYVRLKLHTKAIYAYKSCIEIRPSYAIAHSNLAALYVIKQQYTPAISHLKKAINYDPSDYYPYYLLANIYNKQGLCKKPKDLYNKALSIKPDLVDAKKELREVKRNNCHKKHRERVITPPPPKTEPFHGGGKALTPSQW